MDADTILGLKPALTEFLRQFDGCFARSQTRQHLVTYVQGQLSDLPRKSVEPIADAAGTPPRTLQEFLSLSRWDEPMMRDRLQQRVARRHHHDQAVGIFDETSFLKKGHKTACVQRQHCGAVGKTDNCVVSVHLGYATPDFHTLLDGEPFLPEHTWAEDPPRRAEAEIPEDLSHRPKWQIALDQYHRAVANGVRFGWLTFDEGYGRCTPFLRALDAVGQNYVAEVPADFHAWTQPPEVLHREHARDRRMGRPRRYPRLKAKSNPTAAVANILSYSPQMRRLPWTRYHVKEGSQGPMVWEAKHLMVYLKGEDGLPSGGGRAYHLIVARNPLNTDVLKYFVSNAPESTSTEPLLRVAFSRWRIERMFQDSKGELGMAQFEVRKFGSIQRHLILSCVSHLFLAECQLSQRREKKPSHDQATGRGDSETGADLGPRRPLLAALGRRHRRANRDNTAAHRQSPAQPPSAQTAAIA